MGGRLSEAILQRIVDASRDAMIVVDRHDAVVWASPAAIALDLEGLRHGRLLALARSNLQITRQPLADGLTLVTIRELATSPPLAAETAHDLATPLSTLTLGLEMLAGSDSVRREMRLALRRLEHLLADLRVVAGAISARASETDVSSAAERAASVADAIVREHDATVVVKIDSATRAWADAGALERVLGHLVVNAARSIDRGAGVRTIRIEECRDGAWLAIDVVDTGQGIERGQLERIFDADAEGVGLAICKRLVAEMGGELELRSRRGVGTCARVRLRPAPPGASSDPAR